MSVGQQGKAYPPALPSPHLTSHPPLFHVAVSVPCSDENRVVTTITLC